MDERCAHHLPAPGSVGPVLSQHLPCVGGKGFPLVLEVPYGILCDKSTGSMLIRRDCPHIFSLKMASKVANGNVNLLF